MHTVNTPKIAVVHPTSILNVQISDSPCEGGDDVNRPRLAIFCPKMPPPKSSAESTRIRTIFISPMTVVVTAEVTLMTNEWTMLYARAFMQPNNSSPVHVGSCGTPKMFKTRDFNISSKMKNFLPA